MMVVFDAEAGVTRCAWCSAHPEYIRYHDEEWGYPVADDQRLFEKICLEGFQAGLSWWTILKKRDNFRAGFDEFDFCKVAALKDDDIERLVQDAGIVRHRGKIEAAINNAARAVEMTEEFGSLAAYFWSFEPSAQQQALEKGGEIFVAQTQTSRRLSKDLKARGWKFVGPTTCYAFMQAMGMVNDHMVGCASHAKSERDRAKFERPHRL
ncbi:DNA-3-methyladenine glycosylase I [Celeribacter marinus]|uniref:DNA-3-methyladenine glycosylase I n=1 Tax=Celeribacter marinus TaxID=1397108 RepID=UPI00316DA233